MTDVEFLEVTQEIEKFYSKDGKPNELTTEQSRIWFDELKNLKKEHYRQISREVYRTQKFMPKLADIIEIKRTLPSPVNKEDEQVYKCKKCNGTGYVIYTKIMSDWNDSPYQFATRCTCPNGQKKSHKIPTIEQVGMNYEI